MVRLVGKSGRMWYKMGTINTPRFLEEMEPSSNFINIFLKFFRKPLYNPKLFLIFVKQLRGDLKKFFKILERHGLGLIARITHECVRE